MNTQEQVQFTIDDLFKHIKIFIDAYQKSGMNTSNYGYPVEQLLIECADHIDKMYPQIERESMIDTHVKDYIVNQHVLDWIECSKLLDDVDPFNSYVKWDVSALYDEYTDWCTDQNIVDQLTLYKMLKSLGYKVSFTMDQVPL